MKKIPVALALAGLAYASAASAASADEPWYAGGKLGWSEFHGIKYDSSVPNPRNIDKSGVGAGLFVGYQVNDWLGVEGGYDYLDKLEFDFDPNSRADLKAQGLQLAAKLGAPVADSLDVYARLGVMASRLGSASKHATRASPLAALGVEYALDRNWATRLEYQWTGRLGDTSDVGARTDNGLLSLGLLYKFGGAPAPAPMPVATPAPAPQVREFTLSSDALFDFNKATLKPAGEQALTELGQQIRAEASTDASLTIVGHTDRIGSEQYNLDLSRRRAQTAADFLVARGIPAGQVSVEGAGESSPVTGSQCDGVKQRAELIACLAPDRRVVVKVSGRAAR
ncbi:porin OmpA [Crenobacter cavernae]|uniref:Porin OmpA n=1 Tax=Crenobacter cavernae TaxID=2290923 RepID=A0ABY0FH19_9NEIS|nr:porin OmpA [Crenobacter cavernae]